MDKAIDPQIWLAQAKLELNDHKTTQALKHAEEILNWVAKAIKQD